MPQKLVCGTSTPSDIFNSVNELIDRTRIFIEDFGASESNPNSAPAIMSALAALKKGQVLTSYSKQVTLTESISHTFDSTQEFSSVILLCDFIFDTANTESGIYLDGAGFTFGEITIGPVAFKEFSFNDTTGPDVSTGTGVEIRNFWQTDIDIYQTMNYMVGTKAVGGNLAVLGNGFALSNIRVRQAFCPKISGAIALEVTTEPFNTTAGYFNSNIITCNLLRGQNGIRFTKGSLQTDPFNGNKIRDGSVENTVDVGIELNFSNGNFIDSPRWEGGHVPTTWFKDSIDSARNVIDIVGSVNSELFELNGNGSYIRGVAVSSGGNNLYSQTLPGTDESDATGNNKTIFMANRRSPTTKNNTIYWGGIPGDDRWGLFAGGVLDQNGDHKVFGLLNPYGAFKATNVSGVVQVDSGTSTIELSTTGGAEVMLRMGVDREINGMTIMLDLTFFTDPLSIQKSSGATVIPTGVVTATGLYMLVYKADVWKISRIGDKLDS